MIEFDRVLPLISKQISTELGKDVNITRVTSEQLEKYCEDWKTHPKNNHWNWLSKLDIFRKFSKNLRKFIAIEESSTLCGLAYCTCSKGRTNISIHYIQGSPDDSHPLKRQVFPIIDILCCTYARLNEMTAVRILDPLDNVIHLYQQKGYEMQKKRLFSHNRYMEKKL